MAQAGTLFPQGGTSRANICRRHLDRTHRRLAALPAKRTVLPMRRGTEAASTVPKCQLDPTASTDLELAA